ncbi:RHS repeat-associated core domain-containing protein [Fontisphaera persica]|uniref:RHS repeat-associated core domain-containing protein n=1 Tax=Fontisphaera persica TaxID=2974023 RepID=UPI0024BF49A9|nr:RHS repeat-associated core domain-containing protein [Fontisphaera persica]WCJ61239.1 RHS repeat-associated core domain-containing protein [Fontisphaera persica]
MCAVSEVESCPEVHRTRGAVRTHVWGANLSGTTQGTGSISGGLQAGLAHVVGLGEHTPPACALRRPAEGKLFLHTSNAATEQRSSEHECCPFGELLRATGPLAQTFNHLFSTKYFDWETGLSYYGHRYYSPTTGRWPNRDPIGDEVVLRHAARTIHPMRVAILQHEALGNLYTFNHNNPMGYVDSDGRVAIAIPAGVIIGGGILIGAGICYAIPSCRDAMTQAGREIAEGVKELCRPRPKPPEICPKTGEMNQPAIGNPGDPDYVPAMKICIYTCPKQGVVRRYFPEGTLCDSTITQPFP